MERSSFWYFMAISGGSDFRSRPDLSGFRMTYLLKDVDARDQTGIGNELHQFASDLYPICRSITGNGLRQTLSMLRERIPLRMVELPTGTEVFDWTVPKEWNI